MTLLLAPHLAQPKTQPVRIGVFLTLGQLGGPPATMADLNTELAKLKRSEVIRFIAAVSARLTDPTGRDEKFQLALAKELLSDDLLAGLKKYLRGAKWDWTIFHRRQLSFLLQVAVCACSEESR